MDYILPYLMFQSGRRLCTSENGGNEGDNEQTLLRFSVFENNEKLVRHQLTISCLADCKRHESIHLSAEG